MNSPKSGAALLLCDWEPGSSVAPLEADVIRVLRVDLSARHEVERLDLLSEWAVLSPEEQARALRFVRICDGRRFVLCRGALRLILAGLTGRSPHDVAFRFGPGGKPELATSIGHERRATPRFNVTHSGELALIALSLDRELGVDLERLRVISQADRIVESYFTAAEQVQFAGLDELARAEAFLRGWTRKEAILKGKGVGLAGLAAGYETMFGTEPLSRQFEPAHPAHRIQNWSLWEAAPGEEYVAALALADPEPQTARVPVS